LPEGHARPARQGSSTWPPGLARECRGGGLRLNCPEATAVIAARVLEGARDGRSVADLREAGARS
jgi:urease gamma subunit